jgi:hypothetical protein
MGASLRVSAFRESCSELSVSAGNYLANGFFRLNIDAGRWFGNTNTRLSIASYPYQTISSTEISQIRWRFTFTETIIKFIATNIIQQH